MFFYTPVTAYPSAMASAGGWHAWVVNGSSHLAYANIKPACAGTAGRAFVAAHELIEAATDSGSGDRFGFVQSEVGDLCDGKYQSSAGYLLPTIWSNAAAAAGGDPCVPALGGPFFDVSVAPLGPQTVAPGATATLTLTGWSTAPVGDWRVGGAAQPKVVAEGAPDGTFTVSLPQDMINNGRQITMTVAAAPDAVAGATATIALVSHDRLGGTKGRLQLITVTVGAAR
jgi:hypothetical protein